MTMAKKKTKQKKTKQKKNNMFGSVLHPSKKKNIAKSVAILKLGDRSFKWDLAGCPSFIRLEMALELKQVVKNLKIHCATFMGYLYFDIKT